MAELGVKELFKGDRIKEKLRGVGKGNDPQITKSTDGLEEEHNVERQGG